jgi:hypothetical protein
MIAVWQELMLSSFFAALIMIVWFVWEITHWDKMEIDLSMDELKEDLYSGLRLQKGDDD